MMASLDEIGRLKVRPLGCQILDKKKPSILRGKYRWPNTLRGKRLTHLLTSLEASVTQTRELYNSSRMMALSLVNDILTLIS